MALHRFLGFAEGRLGVILPAWWQDLLLSGKAGPDDSDFHFSHSAMKSRLGTDDKLQRQGAIVHANGELFISFDKALFKLPRELIGAERWESSMRVAAFRADVNNIYMAVYASRPVPYKLARWHENQWVWMSDVRAGGHDRTYTGKGFHLCELGIAGDNVVVFGGGDDVLYIQAFNWKTGEAEWQFSTR